MRKWAWNKIRYPGIPDRDANASPPKIPETSETSKHLPSGKAQFGEFFLGPGSLRACCSVRPAIIGTHTVPWPPGGRLSRWSPENRCGTPGRMIQGPASPTWQWGMSASTPLHGGAGFTSEWIRMVPVIGCLKCEIGSIGKNTGKPSNRRVPKGPSKTYTMVAMVILQGLHPHLSCSRWGQIGPLPSMPSAVRYLYHRLRGSVQNSANMFYQSSITGYHRKDLEHHTGIISKATVESALRNADSSSKPSCPKLGQVVPKSAQLQILCMSL